MQPNIRRCIVCRKAAPKQEFWRIVRIHPSHEIALDEGMGRSAYLCPEESCLKIAQKKNRLGKSLRSSVPESVYHELTYRLSQDYFAKNEHRR